VGNPRDDDLTGSGRSAPTRKCFILTAAYGSELETKAYSVHEFINEVLLKSRFEKPVNDFLNLYFQFSPPIARQMRKRKWLKYTLKYLIVWPFVSSATLCVFIIKLLNRQKRN